MAIGAMVVAGDVDDGSKGDVEGGSRVVISMLRVKKSQEMK